MRNSFGIFLVLFFFGLMVGLPVKAQQPAGQVERQKGTASRTTSGITSVLELSGKVLVGDEIRTGENARLLILFEDGSTLTLGENARVTINQFVYDATGASSQVLAIVVGFFRYISGDIGKASPRDVIIATPVATIGIRGTEFLGGELNLETSDEPHYGIQIKEGAIEVNSPRGSVVLDEAGEGTFLPLNRFAIPTAVGQWSATKTAEAEEALAF